MFIKLTDSVNPDKNNPIFVNTDNILGFTRDMGNCTKVLLGTLYFTVKESPDEILKLLERKA